MFEARSRGMGETMDRWLNVSVARRDAARVILWLDNPEAPPTFATAVGAWEINPTAGVSYWRVFGAKGMPPLRRRDA